MCIVSFLTVFDYTQGCTLIQREFRWVKCWIYVIMACLCFKNHRVKCWNLKCTIPIFFCVLPNLILLVLMYYLKTSKSQNTCTNRTCIRWTLKLKNSVNRSFNFSFINIFSHLFWQLINFISTKWRLIIICQEIP